MRYKAWLVAQGFFQRPDIDFDQKYSPVIDAIAFQFLLSSAILERLQIRLTDFYGSLDSDIYMKVSDGFKMPESCKSKS